ncbi:hypothetical protein ABZ848_06775 [Streptomyces sp. NPDC047081]|uniref:hypothetical protein n=1 Tax=Streptomyces sp. NPDC047081 TaxID=3154706 RepID=UPI0033E836DB
MAVGRAARRAERRASVEAAFGGEQTAAAALDLLELLEFAWHDCYAEITPDDQVIDDILTCAEGDLTQLIRYTRLAVEDFRDLRLAADAIRSGEAR